MHREIVRHSQAAAGCRQFHEAVAVIPMTWESVAERRIKGPIADEEIDVPRGIRGRTRTRHPDAAFLAALRRAVGGEVEHAFLGQVRLVVADYPARVVWGVAMRSPGR